MNKTLQSLTIATLSWGLMEEVRKEEDPNKIRFVNVDLNHNNETYLDSINFFIENNMIEPTEDESIYVCTDWFYHAAKEYMEHVTDPQLKE